MTVLPASEHHIPYGPFIRAFEGWTCSAGVPASERQERDLNPQLLSSALPTKPLTLCPDSSCTPHPLLISGPGLSPFPASTSHTLPEVWPGHARHSFRPFCLEGPLLRGELIKYDLMG